MHSRIRIGNHVLRKSTIVFETRHLSILAESRVGAVSFAPVLATSNAASARFLEIQDAYAVADFPGTLDFGADLDDFASGFVGRD